MPRRQVLTDSERKGLLAFPDNQDDLIRYYTLSAYDVSVIRMRRGDANRLGFAVVLCCMRYPGVALGGDEKPFPPLLDIVAAQLKINSDQWLSYAQRSETRREHFAELRDTFGFRLFNADHQKKVVELLDGPAFQTDKGIVLAKALVEYLRSIQVLIPNVTTIHNICSGIISRSTKKVYKALSDPMSQVHIKKLDALLNAKEDSQISWLTWLRQSATTPNAKHLLGHIERLKTIEALELPMDLEKSIHQNRLQKLAREGAQMTTQHIKDLEKTRRIATVAANVLDSKARLIDEIVELHIKIVGKMFTQAKNLHETLFQQSGKTFNDNVRLFWKIGKALLDARQNGKDPYKAIESVIPWDEFVRSVNEAEKLAQPESFDFLHHIGDKYSQLRRYAPALLETLHFEAAPAVKDIIKAMEILKEMNASGTRDLPDGVPISFIRKRWEDLVFNGDTIDRKFYELCVFFELRNSLRSGDIWVQGSRQFKDFKEYLIPVAEFDTLKHESKPPLAVILDLNEYLADRVALLQSRLKIVNEMAENNELLEVTLTEEGLKISPLTNSVPQEAESLMEQINNLLPHVKITDLLDEVDQWTGFTKHFTHLKSGETSQSRTMLMTTILADAINLGLTKMAESCPGTSYAKLSWLQSWHIRDETYSTALAELVNAQLKNKFAGHWGDGTTSSSDGQRFRSAGEAERSGNVNPKYGSEPGVQFYTHISDQYSPFHTKVINVGVRDATYVLDGLLYHESDLQIEEHYTDTAGFTDHVFALMHLLGFRFAPRIRDLVDKRLYVPSSPEDYPALASLIGGTINQNHIRANWDDVLRLSTSIQQGAVTASLMIRKLASYPRQNGLALALRELGRIERSLFTLDWLQNKELRRRVNAGLNKGEARNALARAVFFNRLGEIRDRSFESHRYRASGLNLVTAAIVLWNTVYLERAVDALIKHGETVDEKLLQYLSPLGWAHINLTGDYVWPQGHKMAKNEFRPLMPISKSKAA